jgi:iron complex outermembrane recepter protein
MKVKLVLFMLVLISSIFADENSEDALRLSLDKLFSLKVTSVSGTEMDLKKSPAAIYVIDSDDFAEQGHRTIADALRGVPGFHVRRLNASKFAISSRGDNGRYANKLLVLIDGRSVYTPLFSGVYWEIQDLPIEDIARIEVIRGPGATLWGANAVNGVINIVTKDVRDTQGGYVKFGLGNVVDYETEFRYGDQLGDDVFYKLWGKTFDRGESEYSTGQDADDSWRGGHFGLKLDWYMTPKDTHSFQVNFSKLDVGGTSSILNQYAALPVGLPGVPAGTMIYDLDEMSSDNEWQKRNLMWTWTKHLKAASGWTFKAYYDYSKNEDLVIGEERETLDLDFRHWFDINDSNSFIWGLNVTTSEDDITGSDTVYLVPDHERISTYSAFLQNTTTLNDQWSIMYGSKLEYNDQTDVEVQPNVRLTYEYDQDTVFWASWSRAVRRPSRAEDDVRLYQAASQLNGLPGGLSAFEGKWVTGYLAGDRDLDSEELLAYELGMRQEFLNKKLSLDFATFYNDYSNLVSLESDDEDPFRQNVNNENNAQSYGLEMSAKYFVNTDFDFLVNYTWFRRDSKTGNTVGDAEHLVFAGANYKVAKGLSWHTTAYYAGNLESDAIAAYINLDTGLIWSVNDKLAISIWGKNLLDPSHPEGNTEYFSDQTYEIPRSVFVELTYKF